MNENKLREYIREEIQQAMNEAYYGEVADPKKTFELLIQNLEELDMSASASADHGDIPDGAYKMLRNLIAVVEKAEVQFNRWCKKYGDPWKK